MKKQLLILWMSGVVLLVNCSKNDPAPSGPPKDLIGRYVGTSDIAANAGSYSIVSLDITFAKSGTVYSATGSFTIDGKTTTITSSTIVKTSSGGWIIYLNTPLALQLGVTPSTDYNTLTVVSTIFAGGAIPQPYPLTRK